MCGSVTHSVVPDVAGSGTQVDDGSSSWAAVGEGVHVSHDIMTELLLLLRRHGEVDVICVALRLCHLGIGDGQAQSLQEERRRG